jgi:hypothetical protein
MVQDFFHPQFAHILMVSPIKCPCCQLVPVFHHKEPVGGATEPILPRHVRRYDAWLLTTQNGGCNGDGDFNGG